VDVRPLKALVVFALLCPLCACSLGPDPELVYSYDAPDLDTPDDDPLPDLHDGDDAIVELRSGDRFEAKYRGIREGVLEFEDVRWTGPADREDAAVLHRALEDVAEIRRTDWGTADEIVAWTSIGLGVVVFAVYGRGDGGE
jgi:hypothetical protein